MILLHRFLQSVEGGSKNPAATAQEVVDLAKFLYMADFTESQLENVCNMAHIVQYLNKLRMAGIGPSEQITKLQTILNSHWQIMLA